MVGNVKRPKYGNKKITRGSITFDSKKEEKRYQELKLLERAGMIQSLKIQVPFELQPSIKINNHTIRSITYVADFVYEKNGNTIVEDTKGFRTKDYRIKAKMFAYKYGFEIKEV